MFEYAGISAAILAPAVSTARVGLEKAGADRARRRWTGHGSRATMLVLLAVAAVQLVRLV